MIKGLLYITLLTTAAVISWIAFSVYHSTVTSTIAPDTAIIITPIPPSFDRETIEKLKNKKVVPVDLSAGRVDLPITTDQPQTKQASGSSTIIESVPASQSAATTEQL
ncbi:MAG TPA: hypothetical protein VHE53_04445 [Patescibacteria group bacterium]|nr:hypothetical protein [Patescibacteria group bacterium]